MHQNLQVLARGRLADAKFPGDGQPANPVFHQIAVYLSREVPHRMPEPIQDAQPAFASKSAKGNFKTHIDS